MNAKDRGKRPKASGAAFAVPDPPPNHDQASPKFCLNFLRPDFDVHALNAEKQAAFAKTLQKLAASKWIDLQLSPRHGQGNELIPARDIRAPIPAAFREEPKFMAFRYHGKLPMAGVRVGEVYHVLWIEPEFGLLYDHG